MKNWNVENYVFRPKIWNWSYNSKFYEVLQTATFTFSAGKGVEDLETDVIHLLAKTSNFLLVLNSSINFVIYLSIDTKCAIKIIIIVVVIFINLCLNCLWYIQVSSSCSWDVWSVCVSPSHLHPSLHPKVYIIRIWSSSSSSMIYHHHHHTSHHTDQQPEKPRRPVEESVFLNSKIKIWKQSNQILCK